MDPILLTHDDLDKLIATLQKIRAEEGNMEVTCDGDATVMIGVELDRFGKKYLEVY